MTRLAIGILILATAWLLVSPLWNRGWYRATIARPASVAIAASGLYWAVERCF